MLTHLRKILPVLVFCLGIFDLSAQTSTINTSLNQVDPNTVSCGTANVPIYGFAYNVTSGTAVFTGITNFVTSGTYAATDILRIRLYQTNFSVFNTSNLLSTITTGLGTGTHTFPAFSFSMTAAVTRYFWVAVDLAPAAISGRTITCNTITAAMTTITGTENSGTNTAGGTQTISCILPVELNSFTAEKRGAQYILEWTTASETNNSHFTLQYAFDGENFTDLFVVQGAGNTNVLSTYAISDDMEKNVAGIYYRLLQTDFDGHTRQAGEVLFMGGNSANSIDVYPNPVSNIINLNTSYEELDYTIFSGDGKTMRSGKLRRDERTIDIRGMETGIYLLQLNGQNSRETKKIIVEN